MSHVLDRGHLIWIKFNPQLGYERDSRRPACVISPTSYNAKVGLAIICPITTYIKGYPFEVQIPPGLDTTGVIFADQVKSLNWRARGAEYICDLPNTAVQEILQKLISLLR